MLSGRTRGHGDRLTVMSVESTQLQETRPPVGIRLKISEKTDCLVALTSEGALGKGQDCRGGCRGWGWGPQPHYY